MKNLIKKYLREYTETIVNDTNFEEFFKLFKKAYGHVPNSEKIVEEIINDIKKSPTPKIEIVNTGMFCGMSLNKQVILVTNIFYRDLYSFIYVLFHEIAHQYQYKKYGKNILYDLTTGELTNEKLDRLLDIEQTADRFGMSMAKKYGNMFNIKETRIVSPYTDRESGKNSYRTLILSIQDKIKKGEISCVEEMESFLYEKLIPKNNSVFGNILKNNFNF